MFADCWMAVRSPTGEVFKISKDATFQGGRIKSWNKVILFVLLKLLCTINSNYIPDIPKSRLWYFNIQPEQK